MRNTDKKKENKVLMSMRISAEDKELIEEKARKTGLTTSEYMRRCALGRKLPCYGDTGLLREYSMQLGKIGSNLNQIAKHLNGGGDFCSVYYEIQGKNQQFPPAFGVQRTLCSAVFPGL